VPSLIRWLGGAYELNWSVNPMWTSDFQQIPAHAVTRGVKPFQVKDECYFNMRFVEGMKGVTPLLSAVAPPEILDRPGQSLRGEPGGAGDGEARGQAGGFLGV
jgi:hypothetical protein